MPDKVELYKTIYDHDREQIYRDIREATYGSELGQSSWITREEAERFLGWLGLASSSKVLEVACGAGGVSCLISRLYGAAVYGVDITQEAIDAANARRDEQGLGEKTFFSVGDATKRLDFPDENFDAIFCNDAINHLANRANVLADWWRMLSPNGRLLFTDPIVVTGIITNAEVQKRSSIGFYLFTPKGENESLLQSAGFRILQVEDVTEQVASISKRWHEAREHRKEQLLQFEERKQFDGLQNFLSVVHQLAAERRLSRFVYLAQKQSQAP